MQIYKVMVQKEPQAVYVNTSSPELAKYIAISCTADDEWEPKEEFSAEVVEENVSPKFFANPTHYGSLSILCANVELSEIEKAKDHPWKQKILDIYKSFPNAK